MIANQKCLQTYIYGTRLIAEASSPDFQQKQSQAISLNEQYDLHYDRSREGITFTDRFYLPSYHFSDGFENKWFSRNISFISISNNPGV
jgi:hypothetical protein